MPMIRRFAPLAGLVLLLAAWSGVVMPDAAGPFTLHMARHMITVAFAAPLIALAVPTPPWRWLAVVAVIADFLVVWGWHLPALHGAARQSALWFLAEQASFLAAGLLLWTTLLDPRRPLIGAGGLLLTSMHMTLLGALLVLAGRPLYGHGGLAALADQQLGGMLMLASGTPVYLLAGLGLVARALTRPVWSPAP